MEGESSVIVKLNLLTCMKDSFLLLSDEGREGVLLFHQELGGESVSDRGGVGWLGTRNIYVYITV